MPYFNERFIESNDDEFTITDWKEVIDNEQVGGGDSFSLESGESVIVTEVPWNKARSFLRFVLGWSYTDQFAPFQLYRENPIRHPRFPWLTAGTVTFQAKGPVGVTGVGTKVSPDTFSNLVPLAKYHVLYATVRFVDRPWLFFGDDLATTPQAEAQRNTYFDPSPSVEIISAEGLNNIAFANTSGAGSPAGANGPAVNTAVPAPFGTLMSKTNLMLRWMWVPNEYISGDDPRTFTPSKINACVGRVNSAAFMGYPAGTLLMQAPQYQRFRFPVLTANGVYGFMGWNVTFPIQHFDPPRGAAPTDPTYDTYRGHQLIPWRNDLFWYGAKRAGSAAKLYPEADFYTAFQHASA